MERFENKAEYIEILGQRFKFDSQGFVHFGDVARQLMNKQAQYGSRYTDNLDPDYPNFGEGMRIVGGSDSYHDQKIHKDDISAFILKYRAYLGNKD